MKIRKFTYTWQNSSWHRNYPYDWRDFIPGWTWDSNGKKVKVFPRSKKARYFFAKKHMKGIV